jgi:hypothetical protein
MTTLLFALMFLAEASSSGRLARWVGTWTWNQPATRDFKPERFVIWKSRTRPGALHVLGNAYWYGPMVKYNGKLLRDVHFGGVDADGVPAGDRLVLRDGGCEVTLTLDGEEIHAADNNKCGGANARFSGTFVRHKS